MDNQEYYSSGIGYVTIWGEVKDSDTFVIVKSDGDYGDLHVVKRTLLVKKEDSYEYKQRIKRREELEAITAKAEKNLNAVADKVVDAALIALASRLKFNVMFGKNVNGGTAAWAVEVSKELESMVKEKAEEEIKGKKDIF